MVVRVSDIRGKKEEEKKSNLVSVTNVRMKNLEPYDTGTFQQSKPTQTNPINMIGSGSSIERIAPITTKPTVNTTIKGTTSPLNQTSSGKPTLTTQQYADPLRAFNPEIMNRFEGMNYATPDSRADKYVADRLEREAKAVENSPVLSAINKALQPASKLIYDIAASPAISGFQRGAGNVLGIKADTAPMENTLSNKIGQGVGMLAGGFTNPTNLAQGLVSTPYKIGQQVAQGVGRYAPKGIAPIVNNQFVQRGLEGSVAGGIQGGIISGARGETDAGELAKNIGIGAGLGALGDVGMAAIGSGARSIIKKYKGNNNAVSNVNQLALPQPRTRGNVNRTVTDDVITPEYTFGLPKSNGGQDNLVRNINEGKAEIQTIDDEIRILNSKYEQAINDEYQYLKSSMGNKSDPAIVIKDRMTGDVTDRVGSISNNPKWYTDISNKSNGYKKPSNKELYELAKNRVDNGFDDEQGFIPSWKEQNGFDETLATLEDVKSTIGKSINDLETNSPFGNQVVNRPVAGQRLAFDAKIKNNARESARQAEEARISQQLDTPPPVVDNVVTETVRPKESWYSKLFGNSGVGIRAGGGNAKELIDTHVVTNATKPGNVWENIQNGYDKAVQDNIDQFAPTRQISEETYSKFSDASRANNLANVTIKENMVDLDGNVIGKGLKQVYDNVPNSGKDLSDRYLILKDSIADFNNGKKVYTDEPWFPQTADEAAKMVDELDARYPWLQNLSEDWNQFNANRLNMWADSGIVSRGLVDHLLETRPNYVPKMRQQEKGSLRAIFKGGKSGFSNQKAPIKKSTGSTKKIIEPAQSMIDSTASGIQAMLRNRALLDVLNKVKADPEKFRGLIDIVDESADVNQNSLKEMNKILNEDGLEGIADFLNNEAKLVMNKSKQDSVGQDNIVTVLEEGNPIKMKISDPSILRAIDGISPTQLEGVLGVIDVLSRGIKQSATGLLAPIQGAKLFIRDLPIALTQSKDKVNFLQDFSHAMVSQIADWLPKFIPGAEKTAELARRYYNAGGGYEAYLKGDSKIRAAARDITPAPVFSKRGLAKNIKRFNPLKPFKELGDGFENIPRIAAFNASMRKSGWKNTEESIRKALEESREATVNYSRKGAKGQEREALFPYSNAAIQGTYRFAKRFKDQPVSAVALVASVATAKIAAYEKFKDDKDYEQRSKFEKGIPVSKREDGKFVTVPVEPTEAFVGDMILNLWKLAKGAESDNAKEIVQSGADAFLPSYISGGVNALTSDGKTIDLQSGISKTFNGTVFEPISAVTTGKNFFGGDNVPREYQGLATNEQYDSTTSAPGKWAAENLGIDAFTFDYLGKKFGGDIAKVSLPLTSEVGSADTQGNIIDEVMTRLKLLEDPIMKNNISNDYFNLAEKVTQAKAAETVRDTPLPLWYQDVYDQVTSTKKGSIAKAVSELNTEKKEITRSTTLTAKQRADTLREIQSEINLLRIKGIELMEKAGVGK